MCAVVQILEWIPFAFLLLRRIFSLNLLLSLFPTRHFLNTISKEFLIIIIIIISQICYIIITFNSIHLFNISMWQLFSKCWYFLVFLLLCSGDEKWGKAIFEAFSSSSWSTTSSAAGLFLIFDFIQVHFMGEGRGWPRSNIRRHRLEFQIPRLIRINLFPKWKWVLRLDRNNWYEAPRDWDQNFFSTSLSLQTC